MTVFLLLSEILTFNDLNKMMVRIRFKSSTSICTLKMLEGMIAYDLKKIDNNTVVKLRYWKEEMYYLEVEIIVIGKVEDVEKLRLTCEGFAAEKQVKVYRFN